MKRFGKGWWLSPEKGDYEVVPVPVGRPCDGCAVPFKAEDIGVVMPFYRLDAPPSDHALHRECLLRSMEIGG